MLLKIRTRNEDGIKELYPRSQHQKYNSTTTWRETLDANPDYSFLELRVSHIIADLIMCQKSTFMEDKFDFIKKTLKLPRAPNLPKANETTSDFGGL